jgi:membrane-anchored protein YejM (alkaline phosphatase superfamily)
LSKVCCVARYAPRRISTTSSTRQPQKIENVRVGNWTSAGGNYIDNLALSDVALGTLMKVIRSTPDASQTSVIISSDHSWRVDDWKKLSDWTAEEARLSGGRFDTRPVLLVHLPGSKDGQVVSQPVSAMIVHPILEAMLHGQLRSSGDIAALVAGRRPGRHKDR